eukprot:c1279_g1_i1.p1 GENE.c1279_g1_i1~~c1279_g1_i1.p1  ORF type:complete len:766 (+),score=177.08 c1279_g1_i1:48-2300(+)
MSSEQASKPEGAAKAPKQKQQQQQQGKDGKKGGGGGGGGKGKGKAAAVVRPEPPAFIQTRLMMFQQAKIEHEAWLSAQPAEAIEVTLPDGTVLRDGLFKHRTTPLDIANIISKQLGKQLVVALVDGATWDLMRPLEGSCRIELCKFDSDAGKHAFWHSSAHVLGQALEILYGASLGIGPALESGFYYDSVAADGRAMTPEDYDAIEAVVADIVKEGQPFERVAVPKAVALEMFAYNKYKVELITNDIPDGSVITLYRCGPLVDLCRGPHLPNTNMVKAFKVTNHSSAYWKSKQENDTMQRVYGVSFPKASLLDDHLEFLRRAQESDHRRIGIEQELFFFHPLSPGSAFFLPHGARMYSRLIDMIKEQYWKRGYTEVVSPNVYNHKLWITSGHWQNYQENMFQFEVEKEAFALKPMNCPGHCLIFKHRVRSWRELPMRIADFGVLHRNELSGALTGLTRVRRFQQDDAHIFAMPEQIQQEVAGVLDMLQEVYGIFGFAFELKLSTRPAKYLGEIADWDKAEAALTEALDTFCAARGTSWTVNPGDGAFYGPKIDIVIMDALRRKHQCATCQLDFQLPKNFELEFIDDSGALVRPVMIHRAILGSVERMMAILCESYAGKFPLWLSPRQIAIVPVASAHYEYANAVQARLHAAGYYVTSDQSAKTLNNKIRSAEESHHNFILVVGDKEVAAGSVNVRHRGSADSAGKIEARETTMDALLAELAALTAARTDDLAAVRHAEAKGAAAEAGAAE